MKKTLTAGAMTVAISLNCAIAGYKPYGEQCTPNSDECAPGLICFTDKYNDSLCLTDCNAPESEPSWANTPPGLQDTPGQYLYCTPCDNENDCEWGVRYRCAPGYYGTTKDGLTGCTKCPSSGGVAGRSDGGATSITQCYLPFGTTGSDSTGNFTYTSKCYYSN